jgi:predicted acyltransferase
VTLLAGALLATVQPINKNLWTPAFALVCAGLSLLALLVLVMVVDVKGHERLVRPLVYLGANPLAAYVGSEVAGQLLAILPHAEPERSARAWLVRHLFAMLALWIGIARSLHRHRIFLKV